MKRKWSSLALVVAAAIAAGFVACSSNGGAGAGVDAPSTGGGKCGDGVCAVTELHNCPQDCGVPVTSCGDGTCDPAANETTVSCPTDCGSAVVCGDNACDVNGGETSENCPQDCGSGSGSGGSNTPLDCRDMMIQGKCFLCNAGFPNACGPPISLSGCQACALRAFSGVDCDGGAFDGMCADDENTFDCFSDCN